jgi:hypothetical protein
MYIPASGISKIRSSSGLKPTMLPNQLCIDIDIDIGIDIDNRHTQQQQFVQIRWRFKAVIDHTFAPVILPCPIPSLIEPPWLASCPVL